MDSHHSAIQQPVDGGDREGSKLDGRMAKWHHLQGTISRHQRAFHVKQRRCVTRSPNKTPKTLFNAPSVYLPAEAVFVGGGVFLQQSSELQQGELLEQIHLEHRLAANLELGRGRAGPMGVLEAWPAEFLRPGVDKLRREKKHF